MAFIRWQPSSGATLYDVYFGTAASPPLVASDKIASELGSITVPGTLEYTVTLASGTQYYWKIVAKNSVTSTTGDIWTFFTQPVVVDPPPVDPPDPTKGTALLTLVANNAFISRDTGLVAASSDYSCTFWVKPLADNITGQARNYFSYYNSTDEDNEYIGIWGVNNGTNLISLNIGNGVDFLFTTPVDLYVDIFNCIGYVRSGNDHSLYVNQVLAGTITVDITANVFDLSIIGYDGFPTTVNNFEIAWFREWDSALTLAQLGHEWGSRQAIVTSGINCDTPLTNDLLDQSGLDNIWTATGSYGFTDKLVIIDQPVLNLTFETAYEIEVTTTYIQDLRESSIAQPWYKYTALTNQYISIWGFNGKPSVGWRPRVIVKDSANANYPVGNNQGNQNVPWQMPVFAGESYFFNFVTDTGTSTEVLLRIDLIPHVSEAIPTGAILVNDDTEGFGVAFISSIDGDDYHIYRFNFPFPSGEYGDVFSSNSKYVIEDDINEIIIIYDVNFVELSRFDFSNGTGSENIVRVNQVANKAYICQRSFLNTTFTSINSEEVQGPEVLLSSSGASAISSNNEDTILYIAGSGGLANSNIKQWNLISNSFVADLVATVAGYQNRDMLTLSDNTIVALYFKDTVTRDLKAIRYDTSGNILNTYNILSGSTLVSISFITVGYRLAFAIDDPDSFWVWFHIDDPAIGRLSVYQNIRVVDGAVLAEKQEAEYNSGACALDQQFELVNRFGVSSSCPFIIVRTSGGGPIPPPEGILGGIYKIVPGKRNDTLWTDLTTQATIDVEIPQPKYTSGTIP